MPQTKKVTEEDSSKTPPKKNVEGESSKSQPLEAREGRKLNEISRTLTLILEAIRNLTDAVKETQKSTTTDDSNSVKSCLKEVTDALTSVTKTFSENKEERESSLTPRTPSLLAEEEALKVKTTIANLWNFKLEKRRDAFWGHVKNGGHKDVYQKWITSDAIIIPKYIQKKELNYEPENQRKIREKSMFNDFETEIELQGLRAEQHKERYEAIDQHMYSIFEQKAQGEVQTLLKNWWDAQTKHNEEISQRRWRKNESWLRRYEQQFLIEHKDKSPFFKDIETTTNSNNQRRNNKGTSQGNYAQALKRNLPKGNTPRTFPTETSTGKKQSYGVQGRRVNYTSTQRTANARRRENSQTLRNRSPVNRYVIEESDEDDNFLEESESSETLT